MSSRTSRRLFLPGLGTCAAVAAALCGVWLLWSEARERGWIPGVAPPPDQAIGRIQAVEALVRRGQDGIPDLIAALSDADPKVRRSALYGLARLGPDASEQLGLVRARLADDAPDVRYGAVSAFWDVSRDPAVVAPTVAWLLADPDSSVRDVAEMTLQTIWREEMLNRKTIEGASADDEESEAFEPCATRAAVDLLKSGSLRARRGAISVLRKIPPRQRKAEAIDALRTLADDAELHDEVRELLVVWDAASVEELRESLRQQFRPGEALYPPAGLSLRSVGPSGQPRTAVLAAMARRGPGAAGLLPDLVEIFDRLQVIEHQRIPLNSFTRSRDFALDAHVEQILRTLSAMQTTARPAAAHLLARIDDLHDASRIRFAEVLFDIGEETDVIVGILTPILSDERPIDRAAQFPLNARHLDIWEAGKLLVRVSPEEARRQVARAIPKLGSAVSIDKNALFVIYGLAPEAHEAFPVLKTLVNHADDEVAAITIKILGQIGPESAPAVPELVSQLRSSLGSPPRIVWNQRETIETLGKIGPGAKSAVPLVLEILNDPQLAPHAHGQSELDIPIQFVHAAIVALARIGDASPPIQAALRGRLSDSSQWIRVAALFALAAGEPDDDDLLTDLVRLLADESVPVRAGAALAIGNITGDRRNILAPLIAALDDEYPCVRTAAALSLGKIGTAACDSLAALRALVADPRSSRPNRIDPLDAVWPEDLRAHFSVPQGLTLEQAARHAIALIENGSDR